MSGSPVSAETDDDDPAPIEARLLFVDPAGPEDDTDDDDEEDDDLPPAEVLVLFVELGEPDDPLEPSDPCEEEFDSPPEDVGSADATP